MLASPELSDADELDEAIATSLSELKPWMPWVQAEPLARAERLRVLRHFRAKFDMNEDFTFFVREKTSRGIVGTCGLHSRVGEGGIEIGYWVRSDKTGQGVATEMAGALARVALEVLCLDRVEIRCEPTNVKSAAVPKKLGFLHEGTLKRRFPFKDSFRDVMVWTMFASEYSASKVSQMPLRAWDGGGQEVKLGKWLG